MSVAPAIHHDKEMKMLMRILAMTAALGLASSAGLAQTLKVGDPAPSLSVENWVKGAETTGFEKGRVYVVEFWATWCPPCIASIPHLTELQKKHERDGLSVLGIAASERANSSRDDRLANLRNFVNAQGSKMGYSVAFDEDRSMSADWMRPAGRNTIPTAFVVGRDGTIEWVGSPSQGLDGAVTKALAKKVDAQPEAQPSQPTTTPADPTKVAAKKVLEVGDRAPSLHVTDWVKGQPITGFEKGRIYVVEFWATWCGPCISSMPHLSALQREYADKGVTIVGVSASDPNNTLEQVKTMTKDKGDVMAYTVAYDSERETYAAFMTAAKQQGIPTSFVVDQNGNVAYIGHPMWLHEPIEQLVAGTWDPAKGMERIAVGEKLINEAFSSLRGDPQGSLAAFEKLEKEFPDAAKQFASVKFSALLGLERYPEAYAVAENVIASAIANHDSNALNSVAWTIVDPEGNVKEKDLKIAMKAALKADELSGHKDAAIIDTVARVYFLEGNIDKAIELQKKAVGLAQGMMKDMLREALKEYEAAKQNQGG